MELHAVFSESTSAPAVVHELFFSPKDLRTPNNFAGELLTPVLKPTHFILLKLLLHTFRIGCANDFWKTQSVIIPFSLKYMLGFLSFRR